jgi:hypothetical protein
MAGRIAPTMDSGGLLKLYQALWGPYYDATLRVLGATGVLLPIGDPHHGQPDASTFTSKGAQQVTFTWSEAPGSFDIPLDLTDPANFQGIAPMVRFNGTDEEADTPDAAFWSPGDGSNDSALSVGGWFNFAASAALHTLFSKADGTVREWLLEITDAERVQFTAHDESVVGGTAVLLTDSSVNTDRWLNIVFTYDGTGGATAFDSPNAAIYVNGVVVLTTPTTHASYVAMEDLATKPTLAAVATPGTYFAGAMAGGPLGPFYAQKELSAAEVAALYDLGRAALAI